LISLAFFHSFLFLLHSEKAKGQDKPQSPYKQLSCAEKRWVIFHPFIAKKTYRLSLAAREASKELLNDPALDGDENGGQVDAFRHAYWMALLSQNICWKKARSLGKAHEKGNYKDFKKGKTEEGQRPDSAMNAMDLYNNGVGLEIGKSKKKIPVNDLKRMVQDSVLAGRMQIILKNADRLPLDCERNVIDTALYRHQWNIPKCLVASDVKAR